MTHYQTQIAFHLSTLKALIQTRRLLQLLHYIFGSIISIIYYPLMFKVNVYYSFAATQGSKDLFFNGRPLDYVMRTSIDDTLCNGLYQKTINVSGWYAKTIRSSQTYRSCYEECLPLPMDAIWCSLSRAPYPATSANLKTNVTKVLSKQQGMRSLRITCERTSRAKDTIKQAPLSR